ncbi:uncharacterized protein LOC129808486 [Phlebotomus papatasi]|uniref:uncharacterized protein LOC129808486 n=1 Tax=Phlebotomus papatasi TaxID=29031 RepID=UPI002483E6E1|nr:uncharacterized protein LOC129808486 [Phlebotomus papatasi]
MNLMKIHTSLISSTLSEINETRHDLRNIVEKLSEVTSRTNLVTDKLSQLETVENLNDAEKLLNLEMESIEHDQNQLLVVINSALNGHCHPLLLHPDRLEEEVLSVKAQLPDSTILPRVSVPEMYELGKVSIISNSQQITAIIKIPLCDNKKYQLFKILPLPYLSNNSSKIIQVDYPYIATDPRKESYSVFSNDVFSKCKNVNHMSICTTHVVYSSILPNCEFSIINNEPGLCRQVTLNVSHNYWIHVSENAFLYILPKSTRIRIMCNQKQSEFYRDIQGKGILRLKPNCEANDNGIKLYSSSNTKSDTYSTILHKVEDIKAITFNKTISRLTPLTITSHFNSDHFKTLTQQVEDMRKIENNLENSWDFVGENLYTIITGSVLTTLLIFGIAWCIYVKKFKSHASQTNDRARPSSPQIICPTLPAPNIIHIPSLPPPIPTERIFEISPEYELPILRPEIQNNELHEIHKHQIRKKSLRAKKVVFY